MKHSISLIINQKEKRTVTSVMKLESLVLLFVLLLASVAATKEGIPGGWSPIKNINDPHVKEIADFAVTEYNRRSGAKLKLQRVIKGDTQVVAGTNYRLILAANDGSASSNYEAIVWEKLWQHYRNLTSFNPVHA